MRLLMITDFTEQFSYKLLRGIMAWSRRQEQPWVVCKMPPSYKREIGIPRVVEWAKNWRADVVVGQFDPDDDVTLFRKNGIVAIAQDYITQFEEIPNLTGDYYLTGAMAARRLCGHGFKHFGFFGYENVCWSDGRLKGFQETLQKEYHIDDLHIFTDRQLSSLWSYDTSALQQWLHSLPKPIAIFACDDNQAEILLETCQAAGINVPLEVAIIGVDNDEVTCNLTSPAITSINVDIEKAGFELAQMATRMVQDRSYRGEDIVIRPVAVVARGSTGIQATNDPVVASAMRFIYQNRMRKILVADVLREVPVSRRLLEQRFKAVTGASLYTVISNLRIDYFAQQLITSSDTVSEIAARMDEADTKSLSRRFRALKGCTPTEYRKKKLRKL
ncbi:MAG: XylR family transcriptional regulator [Candidatus Cryptobacteroides sp.]|nr:XylR family transcriptional regulator [Candidatus Cryptobacteroides sp.]